MSFTAKVRLCLRDFTHERTTEGKIAKAHELFRCIEKNRHVMRTDNYASYRISVVKKLIELVIVDQLSEFEVYLQTIFGIEPPVIDTCLCCFQGGANRLPCGHHAHWACLNGDPHCPYSFCKADFYDEEGLRHLHDGEYIHALPTDNGNEI